MAATDIDALLAEIPEPVGDSIAASRCRKELASIALLRARISEMEAEIAARPKLTVEQIVGQAARAAAAGRELEPTNAPAVRECKQCHTVKAISEFYSALRDGRRQYKWTCKQCHLEKYNRMSREMTALRKALARVEEVGKCCQRCGNRNPAILFPAGGKTCYPCKVEILEAEKAALLDRVPRGDDWKRECAQRQRHANPWAGIGRSTKRLHLLLRQSDGTLTADVVGRMFAEAEGKPCPYCGTYMDRKTKSLDHMIAITKGGLHSAVNAIICCLRCNTRKSNLDFGDWLPKLKEPFASQACAEYLRRYGSPPAQSRLTFEFTPAEIAVN
jgi:5-methylcytosine-specific restriction endonuclease McrA